MQRYFMNKINISDYDCFGFDLDGTLYDEFEFITQAYYEIAGYISSVYSVPQKTAYMYMKDLWIQYGSAKQDLFQLIFSHFTITPTEGDIKNCVNLFRGVSLKLQLPQRSKYYLDSIKESNKFIFLVTDGNSTLQRKKIGALGLESWFPENCIFVSGDYGKNYQKPNTAILSVVNRVIPVCSMKVAYFGDRGVDKEFAKAAGFDFIYAPCMQNIFSQIGDEKYECIGNCTTQ